MGPPSTSTSSTSTVRTIGVKRAIQKIQPMKSILKDRGLGCQLSSFMNPQTSIPLPPPAPSVPREVRNALRSSLSTPIKHLLSQFPDRKPSDFGGFTARSDLILSTDRLATQIIDRPLFGEEYFGNLFYVGDNGPLFTDLEVAIGLILRKLANHPFSVPSPFPRNPSTKKSCNNTKTNQVWRLTPFFSNIRPVELPPPLKIITTASVTPTHDASSITFTAPNWNHYDRWAVDPTRRRLAEVTVGFSIPVSQQNQTIVNKASQPRDLTDHEFATNIDPDFMGLCLETSFEDETMPSIFTTTIFRTTMCQVSEGMPQIPRAIHRSSSVLLLPTPPNHAGSTFTRYSLITVPPYTISECPFPSLAANTTPTDEWMHETPLLDDRTGMPSIVPPASGSSSTGGPTSLTQVYMPFKVLFDSISATVIRPETIPCLKTLDMIVIAGSFPTWFRACADDFMYIRQALSDSNLGHILPPNTPVFLQPDASCVHLSPLQVFPVPGSHQPEGTSISIDSCLAPSAMDHNGSTHSSSSCQLRQSHRNVTLAENNPANYFPQSLVIVTARHITRTVPLPVVASQRAAFIPCVSSNSVLQHSIQQFGYSVFGTPAHSPRPYSLPIDSLFSPRFVVQVQALSDVAANRRLGTSFVICDCEPSFPAVSYFSIFQA